MKRQAKPVLSIYPILIGKGLGPDQGLILLALDLGRPDLALGSILTSCLPLDVLSNCVGPIFAIYSIREP